MTIPYTTGTVSVTAGSAVVTGVGTAWLTAGVVGGVLGLDRGDGNPIPILSVDSDTSITLAKPWRGATVGAQPYWIVRDTAYLRQITDNAQRLSTYLARLDNASLAALAAVSGTMAADRVPMATGPASVAWKTIAEALGFFPTQQGGGDGQLDNKLRFGWNGSSKILAQVDGLALGGLWTDNQCPYVPDLRGFQRFPTGITFQWGYETTASSDFIVNFPVTFTRGLLSVVASPVSPTPTGLIRNVNIGALTVSSFGIHKRYAFNGGAVGEATEPFMWLAVGYI
jgi:hypothetical protein